MEDGTELAALDLGSNSFRLEIARLEQGQLRRLNYIKETVRQGGSLDAERKLTLQAMQRGWDCLERFARHLAGLPAVRVRAVATQTLREARNRDVFLQRAQQILGTPIEVISGHEEARLTYLGVTHLLPPSPERRLVVDIGGRSTEFILGQGQKIRHMASYPVGSVAWSQRHFARGQFTVRAFAEAQAAARQVLQPALTHCPPQAWDTAYGSAGTVDAVGTALQAAGWPADTITRAGLDWLYAQLLQAQNAAQLQLPGLRDDHRHVIGGGVSVLRAAFELLGIERLHMAQGGLRHGALLDMLARAAA